MALVVGRYRWQRRRALARLGFAGTDPFGRPTSLFITDSQRKASVVAASAEARTTFEPETRVVGQLLADLWSRFGDGRALLTPPQQIALALPVVAGSPDLASLEAPVPLAAHLVDLLGSELRMARQAETRPAVRDGLERLRRAWDGDRQVHPELALIQLRRQFEQPGPALAAWLRRATAVVVDDLVQLPPSASQALLALLAAWVDVGVPVAISFECGNDLGPAGLPAFFGAGEPGWEDRTFAATRRWRREVFERFVGRGAGRILLAGADDPEELGPDGVIVAPDLMDDLQAGRPVERVPDGLRFTTLPDVREEVRRTIADLLGRLEKGAEPEQCWIALADPGAYRHVVDAELERVGLQADRGDAPGVTVLPAGQVARLVLRGVLHELEPLEWLALAERTGTPFTLVRSALAPAGVHRGPPGSWRGRMEGYARRSGRQVEPLLEELAELEQLRIAIRLPDRDAWSPGDFLGWLRGVLVELAAPRPDDRSLQVQSQIDQRLERLGTDLEAVGADLSVEELAELALREVGSLRAPCVSGRIAVTGVLELRGHTPQHLWLLGTTRSCWPAPLPGSPLVDARERARLAPADRLAEARYTLASLIRNLVGRPPEQPGSLSVSWPQAVGGRPTVVSRVVAEILEGLPEGTVESPGCSALQSLPRVPGAPRGRLPTPLPAPERLGVTAAESAMQCPARFWYQHLLELRPEDPWDPELEPRRRGTALHRIFQELYEGRSFAPIQSVERDRVARELHRIATGVLDEVEAAGGFEPSLQAWARGRWLAGLIDEAPLGILGAWLQDEIERGRAPASVERPVALDVGVTTLVGKVDRVDELNGVLGVVDYKTGQPPRRDRVEHTLALQPLVYLVALAPEGPAASAYQLVGRPDAIRFAGWFGDPEAVRVLGGSRGVEADREQRAERMEKVAQRLAEVFGGAIHPTEWGEELGGCTTCSFARVCRVKHDREPPC